MIDWTSLICLLVSSASLSLAAPNAKEGLVFRGVDFTQSSGEQPEYGKHFNEGDLPELPNNYFGAVGHRRSNFRVNMNRDTPTEDYAPLPPITEGPEVKHSINRLESAPLMSLCAEARRAKIQLSHCSAHYITCERESAFIRTCPFPGTVFVDGRCMEAKEVPACRDSEINLSNEDTRDLAESEKFCISRGSGVFRIRNGCQDQAIICDMNEAKTIVIGCSVASVELGLYISCSPSGGGEIVRCENGFIAEGQRCRPIKPTDPCNSVGVCRCSIMANARSGRMQDANNAKRATGWKEKIATRQIKCFPITEIYEFSISNAMCDSGSAYVVSCEKYFVCENGEFVEKSCPYGTSYDVYKQQCTPNKGCVGYSENYANAPKSIESNYTESRKKRSTEMRQSECRQGDVTPSRDCQTFFFCDQGQFKKAKCEDANGHWSSACFDCNSLTHPDKGEMNDHHRHPAECKDGQYSMHPEKCDAYFECKEENWTMQKCPAGKLFSASIVDCDDPTEDVECGNSITLKCTEGEVFNV
ncbi:hypothetical protein WR25_01497 [Diploscapter pachys]|uniref:Chitin-binding type-2 domain-containing protein n=1 Tax=Diploscapter pachys TaxID=2018661 RepID=A0A2A2JR61_9BILA|nr:hypothetical protein WR25_01497 [Diploscapter pachys]